MTTLLALEPVVLHLSLLGTTSHRLMTFAMSQAQLTCFIV